MPSDFDVARWTMEHTDALNTLIADLEEQGCELFIEHQNGFRVAESTHRRRDRRQGRPDSAIP